MGYYTPITDLQVLNFVLTLKVMSCFFFLIKKENMSSEPAQH